MYKMQELEELAMVYGREAMDGKHTEAKEVFLSKLFEGVKLFANHLPSLTEDILETRTIEFEGHIVVTFEDLEEVLVALRIFEYQLTQREKEIESLSGDERARGRDGMFIYKSRFDRILRLVASKISEESMNAKREKTVESLLKAYSLAQVKLDIAGYDGFSEKLEVVDSTLESLHNSESVKEYIPERIKGLESDLLKLRNELVVENALEKQRTDFRRSYNQEIRKMHLEVFHLDGFVLFDYLMKNHLSSGVGWQSDVAFFYRRMREIDNLIHANQKEFNKFLLQQYPSQGSMGKYKTWNDVNNEKRRQAYNTAKEVIGLK